MRSTPKEAEVGSRAPQWIPSATWTSGQVVLVTFLVSVTKHPTGNNLREEVIILPHCARKHSPSWWGSHGVSSHGHVASLARKQREKWMLVLGLLSPRYLAQELSLWNGAAH